MECKMKFMLAASGFVFVAMSLVAHADDLSAVEETLQELENYSKLPPGPERDECKVRIDKARAKTTYFCDQKPNADEQFACYLDLSAKGSGDASWVLGEAYAGKSQKIKGLSMDGNQATKYKLLAYEQANLSAKGWYYSKYIPPQPYKWKVGMSKNQVLHSIDGEPVKVVRTTSSNGATEIWFYHGATLYFGPKNEWGLLEIIQEQQF